MPAQTREISLLRKVLNSFAANTSSFYVGPGEYFLEKKRLAPESDHSPPASTELKNEWSYNPLFPTPFLGLERGNFNFYMLEEVMV
jgi:hypothetical protein